MDAEQQCPHHRGRVHGPAQHKRSARHCWSHNMEGVGKGERLQTGFTATAGASHMPPSAPCAHTSYPHASKLTEVHAEGAPTQCAIGWYKHHLHASKLTGAHCEEAPTHEHVAHRPVCQQQLQPRCAPHQRPHEGGVCPTRLQQAPTRRRCHALEEGADGDGLAVVWADDLAHGAP